MGPIPTERFELFAQANGWSWLRKGRHGNVWSKPGALWPLIIPQKRDIYPIVVSSNLRTMGLAASSLREWLEKNP